MSIGRPTHVGGGLACTITLGDGMTFRATTHCVDRFWERVATGASRFQDAKERLMRLAHQVGKVEAAPDWYPNVDGTYVSLGPDIGLILRDDIAVTCISRGGYMSDARRAGRNASKKWLKEKKARRRGR